MRLPSANSGRPCTPGSTTRSSSLPTTRRSTGASSSLVVPHMASRHRGCRSPVRSSLLVRNGESIRQGCLMSAPGFVSLCVTMTPSPMRRRVHASCSLPRPRDGGTGDGHDIAHEASALRLISAVLAEIHEEWLTDRQYLNLAGWKKQVEKSFPTGPTGKQKNGCLTGSAPPSCFLPISSVILPCASDKAGVSVPSVEPPGPGFPPFPS